MERIGARLQGPSIDVGGALRDYIRVESSRSFDVQERYQVHEGLLRVLKECRDPSLGDAVESLFTAPLSGEPAACVLLLKSVIGPRFPGSREKRAAWLARAAREKEPVCRWGMHLLAESRWPEGVDALIAILAEEEKKDPEGVLAAMASAELYRVLGSKGLGSAGRVRRNWEDLGRKVPDQPDRSTGGSGITPSFFGDRLSPRSVLAVDISSSMKQPAVAPSPTGGAAGGETRPKLEIVKEELERAVAGLQSSARFAILVYDARPLAWREGVRPVRLHCATGASLRSARGFARSLVAGQGTNISTPCAPPWWSPAWTRSTSSPTGCPPAGAVSPRSSAWRPPSTTSPASASSPTDSPGGRARPTKRSSAGSPRPTRGGTGG